MYVLFAGLTDEQKEGLKAAVANCFALGNGYIVDKDHLEQVEEALGIQVLRTVDSEFDGVVTAVWMAGNSDGAVAVEEIPSEEESSKFSAEFITYSGLDQRPFEKIFKRFAGLIERNVEVRVPHSQRVIVEEKDAFQVHIWSSPKFPEDPTLPRVSYQSINCPTTFYGIPVMVRDSLVVTENLPVEYEKILDDEGSWLATLYKQDILFVHHDICHYAATNEFLILTKLLTQVFEIMKMSPEERQQIQLKRMKKQFVKFMHDHHKRVLDEKRTNYNAIKEKIRVYTRELTNYIRQGQGLEHDLHMLENNEYDTESVLDDQVEQIFKHKKVKNLTFEENTMVIETNMLHCFDARDDLLHEIGEFKMKVDVVNNRTRFFNQTRQVLGYRAGMQAPHVFPNGEPCLGSASSTIVKLCSEFELYQLVCVMINFIETAYVSDEAGQHIDKWPVVDPVTKKILANSTEEFNGVNHNEEEDEDEDEDEEEEVEEEENE